MWIQWVLLQICCNLRIIKKQKYLKILFLFSVPPGRPLIHNERGILVETTLGPYNEGSKLRLTCSVSGGKILFIPFMLKYYYIQSFTGL